MKIKEIIKNSANNVFFLMKKYIILRISDKKD